MGLLDFFVGRAADDYITVALIIFLVLVGLYLGGVDVSGVIGSFQGLSKVIVAFAAGASGVYILYKTQKTRSPADDILGAVLGLALVGFAGYIMFGQSIISYMESAGDFMRTSLPYIVGGAVALGGVKLAQSRDRASELVGIAMIVLGAIILGIKLTGWW